MLVRLQKWLADAGVASRRASEAIILEGRVAVNGVVVRELGARVDPAVAQVTVDGQPVRPRRKLHVALHKPPGYLCTRQDPENRRTVFALLPPEWRHLYPVGRLDRDSEGLMLLTNDGEFCLRLTHPRYGVLKKYHVLVEGRVPYDLPAQLTRGVRDAGQVLRAHRARVLEAHQRHSLLEIELNEGKNREIRRLLARLGWSIERLARVQIGPLKLGELPPGKWRMLTPAEIRSLLAQATI
ncbi:MAG: rRNA pseudouridine synthase [Verrucomicrobiae bacterium]|nr:rRNA pseudouridine synthase [Verrucomicrobiae bacterium]